MSSQSTQQAATDSYKLPDTLQKDIKTLLDKYKIPGISISVVRKKEGKWEEGVTTMGIRDGTGAPWQADSKHGIASASKIITASCIGLLIDRGTTLPNGEKLGWNTKIKSVLPDWTLVDKNMEENADIEDALSMRLGIPTNNASFGAEDDTIATCVHRMRYHKPAAPLRKTVIYSNDNFSTVGEVITKLTGKPFQVFAKENILDPLGMTDSTYERDAALASGRRVEGFLHYGRDGEKTREALGKGEWTKDCVGEIGQTTFWNTGDGLFNAAAGGVWTTGNDVLRWLKESLDPKVISQATLTELNRPRQAWGPVEPPHPSLSMHYYGIGQYTWYYRGHRIVGHGGGLPGHYTLITRLPESDIALAVFCNDENFGNQMVAVATMMIMDEMLGLEKVDWEEAYILKGLREEAVPSQPPMSARPSLDISGKYHHPAYGPLTITPIDDHPLGPVFRDLLKEYPGNTIPLQPSPQIYLGDLQHDIAGTLFLTPFDGPIFTRAWFKAEDIQLMGKEGGRRYAGFVYGHGKCVAAEGGIGMFEDFWGQGGAVGGLEVSKCVEEGVAEKAEVFFKKV